MKSAFLIEKKNGFSASNQSILITSNSDRTEFFSLFRNARIYQNLARIEHFDFEFSIHFYAHLFHFGIQIV